MGRLQSSTSDDALAFGSLQRSKVRRLENKSFATCAVLEAEGRKFDAAHLTEANLLRMVNMDQKDRWAMTSEVDVWDRGAGRLRN
jgi:hypothetical protein